jgi:hypothetical protein
MLYARVSSKCELLVVKAEMEAIILVDEPLPDRASAATLISRQLQDIRRARWDE